MTIWTPRLDSYPGPRYKALAEAIADDIRAGRLKPAEKLPTHRSLAEQLGVTVGTITRGYAEAEKRELVVARMGSGTYVNQGSNGMSDYLLRQETEDQIDMSLSTTLSHGQESPLSGILAEIARSTHTLQSLMHYQFNVGCERHRKGFAEWLNTLGFSADWENLVICNGGQNAIHTILQAVTRAGDRVVSDQLTYPGFTFLARQHQLRHFGIEMDEHGLIPDALKEICQKHQPKLLYCMPNLQNPTSTSLPLDRRYRILEIAEAYNLYIIEDQVQGLFQSDPLPALHQIKPERIFLTTSFSKLFAGGLRIGLILPPRSFQNSVISALYLDCLFAPPLMAEVACRSIETGILNQLIDDKRKEMEIRQHLAGHILSGIEIRSQPECPHCWIDLPDPWQADEFVLQLQQSGVLLKGENAFAVQVPRQNKGLRICLSGPRERLQVEKGLNIIRETIARHPVVSQSIM